MSLFTITGGAGFIGSHLADALLAAGFSEDAVERIMGGNLLRVLAEIWGG